MIFDYFDIERDLPKFLESVLKKSEDIFQNIDGKNDEVEVHAEVVDKSIALIRGLQENSDVLPADKEALDSLAVAFTSVLALLQHHIAISTITPTTLASEFVTLKCPCLQIIPSDFLADS